MNGPLGDGTKSQGTERFRELAGVGLYHDNVFAVTGLPATAQGAAVRRQRQKLETRLAVEQSWPGDSRAPVPGRYQAGTVRAAFDALQDPRRRLVDELCWYWGEETSDCGCPAELHREHDAAVDAHARAVAAEEGRLDLPDQDRTDLWQRAAVAWGRVLDHAELREHVAHRIRTLGDPRLDESQADGYLTQLPELLVSPFTQLSARPDFDPAAAAPWADVDHFATPLAELFERKLAATDLVVKRELRAAEEERNAGRYGEAVRILREEVVPEFERFEDYQPFVSPWRYDALAHSVSVGLNNMAVELHRHHSNVRATERQRRTALELAEMAYDIAPERDEAELMENWKIIQEWHDSGGRPRTPVRQQSAHPGLDKFAGISCLLLLVAFLVLWVVVGFGPALIVLFVGCAVLGWIVSVVERF